MTNTISLSAHEVASQRQNLLSSVMYICTGVEYLEFDNIAFSLDRLADSDWIDGLNRQESMNFPNFYGLLERTNETLKCLSQIRGIEAVESMIDLIEGYSPDFSGNQLTYFLLLYPSIGLAMDELSSMGFPLSDPNVMLKIAFRTADIMSKLTLAVDFDHGKRDDELFKLYLSPSLLKHIIKGELQ